MNGESIQVVARLGGDWPAGRHQNRPDGVAPASRPRHSGGNGMKKLFAIMVVMLIVALPAAAGDKAKCKGSGEDCLAKMKTKLAEKPWLGIEYETDEHGHWVVKKVYDGSPAQAAGFQKGDILLAMQGEKYSKDNKEALKAISEDLKPGSEVEYVVKRQGGKMTLDATLAHVPKDLQKLWIAEHMEKNHPEYQMASK
jgi:S1-C subfamily serine protease